MIEDLIIRNIIREALGVPSNILEVSQRAYNRILSWVKNLTKEDFESGKGANVIFRVDLRISDYHFSTMKVKLGVDEHPNVIEPEIISMAVRSQSKKTDELRLEPIKTKTVDLVIVMVVPENFHYEELDTFFIENENEILNNLAHEFKHVYDHFKKQSESPYERAEYQSVLAFGFNVEPMDRFLHDIYYISSSENLVRPSEVASAIKTGKISQSDFLNFLRSNETYRNLKRISEFDIEKFKSEILRNKKQLNSLLRQVKIKPKTMTDEEKVNAALQILYSSITNAKISQFEEMIKTSFLEELLGFQEEKKKIFERFVRRNSRFENNPEGFVEYYKKLFNFVGKKMIRKIAKLYAMTGVR